MAHISENRDALLARVKRIAGQIAAVERAIAGDADCSEVLHVVAAVRGAVNGLLDEVIVDHLEAHVAAPGLSEEERHKGAEDLATVIRRYTK
ncbi:MULTISPECIES: metal/formaldehyde-sensitive transcriptional repressor [unclassified Novosphingobium]|jgi:DNA-binding FrmR family transcriptional regulator|uniref:metal/formaldehyde-sensitive transcriptional repressor n=1 Tax=unclassified Novosphingobium TaxID=2644732 RepID=UPI001066694C|nr:metal/formaldehyde-sensitive transcriptional repressor [Novosphingobium sp. PhB55]TDW64479.1 DNA-binding FrmR family transcriptional regulator [Novosphingobium sp. PhB55]